MVTNKPMVERIADLEAKVTRLEQLSMSPLPQQRIPEDVVEAAAFIKQKRDIVRRRRERRRNR